VISDQHAGDLLQRVMELAIAVRDLDGDDVARIAHDIVADAGDPVIALTVAAALIRIDRPVDTWWQRLQEAPLSAEHGRELLYGVSTDVNCATPSTQAIGAHFAADQELCAACAAWRAEQPSLGRKAVAA
jgi:hypothetical protein